MTRCLFTFRTPIVVSLPDTPMGLVIAGEGVQEDAAGGRVRLCLDALVFDKGYTHRPLATPLTVELSRDAILSAQHLP